MLNLRIRTSSSHPLGWKSVRLARRRPVRLRHEVRSPLFFRAQTSPSIFADGDAFWSVEPEVAAPTHPIFFSKRAFDISFACLLLVLLAPILLVLAILVKLTSEGPALYSSDRVGLNNQIFRMPKFRSMRTDTPEVAPHLLVNAAACLSPIGTFLRKSSLDELPQLWSILRGDLSFVGPRPALYNEHELIALRTQHDVHRIMPGLTGWAQVNGRNNLGMDCKVRHDAEYIERRSFYFDCHIMLRTVLKVAQRDGISH